MALLEIEGLSKSFGKLVAVSDLTMHVDNGEIVSLIGPNGAGKTTVFNVVTGVFKPSAGRVRFAGEDVTGFSPDRLAQKGLVRTWQANVLFKERTALENVVIGHYLHCKSGISEAIFATSRARGDDGTCHTEAVELLKLVGLEPYRDFLAKDLPHGMQRLLGQALALATRPQMLLLDEPVTGMSSEETTNTMKLISRIRDRGITVLLVEHNMRAVMNFSDRIVVLNYGYKIAEGNPQEIAQNEAVIEAYLGTRRK